MLRDRWRARRGITTIADGIAEILGVDPSLISARLRGFEHHRCHLASSFLVSPFAEATLVSVDGFGDFTSAMRGHGQGNTIRTSDQVYFPHSLGTFYLAMTQFLGFANYGDEYKVMGLAGHGAPEMMEAMEQILQLSEAGKFKLNLSMFRHHTEGLALTWNNGTPELDAAYSEALVALLGPARQPEENLTDRHLAIAASVQRQYERALHGYVATALKREGSTTLCLSGGCAMNSSANGKLTEEAGVEHLYIPPAPGDAGGAVGAALLGRLALDPEAKRVEMRRADLGPAFDAAAVTSAVSERGGDLADARCSVRRFSDSGKLIRAVAERIAGGGVVGWSRGAMEWGPRALGNRSILADPRRAGMREILNAKIKLREPFRPFAPSVLREAADDWFLGAVDVPFMSQVLMVRPEMRDRIPAVVHVDGTGRLQTVNREDCPLYHAQIREFQEITGIPMLLNTSFNENEPIVATPTEALDCFLRTGMDMLAIEDTLIERPRDS